MLADIENRAYYLAGLTLSLAPNFSVITTEIGVEVTIDNSDPILILSSELDEGRKILKSLVEGI